MRKPIRTINVSVMLDDDGAHFGDVVIFRHSEPYNPETTYYKRYIFNKLPITRKISLASVRRCQRAQNKLLGL